MNSPRRSIARWPPFASIDGLAGLDAIAQRYHLAPALQLGVTDPLMAYRINEAAMLVGLELEQRAIATIRERGASGGTTGPTGWTPPIRASIDGADIIFPKGKIPIVRNRPPRLRDEVL